MLRQGDTVARLGGDEFALLLEDGAVAAHVAAAVGTAFSAAFEVAGSPVRIGASTGLVHLAADAAATTAGALLLQADTAMYAAKRGGKGRLEVFRDGMTLAEAAGERRPHTLADTSATGGLGRTLPGQREPPERPGRTGDPRSPVTAPVPAPEGHAQVTVAGRGAELVPDDCGHLPT